MIHNWLDIQAALGLYVESGFAFPMPTYVSVGVGAMFTYWHFDGTSETTETFSVYVPLPSLEYAPIYYLPKAYSESGGSVVRRGGRDLRNIFITEFKAWIHSSNWHLCAHRRVQFKSSLDGCRRDLRTWRDSLLSGGGLP